MPLTRYGLREWITITIAAIALASVMGFFVTWWAAAGVGIIWLAVISFFRDPIRRIPADLPPGAMLAPSDGVVSAVLEVDHHEAIDGPACVVRVFMSVLNVHVNRSPCAGEIISTTHTPGRFLNAQTDESASVNENNLITMRIDSGSTIGVRQIAGMIARRIVCAAAVGDRLARGEKFGMVKFGSATELILPSPDAVIVHVKKGDKVKAGRTVLATLDETVK